MQSRSGSWEKAGLVKLLILAQIIRVLMLQRPRMFLNNKAGSPSGRPRAGRGACAVCAYPRGLFPGLTLCEGTPLRDTSAVVLIRVGSGVGSDAHSGLCLFVEMVRRPDLCQAQGSVGMTVGHQRSWPVVTRVSSDTSALPVPKPQSRAS